MLEKNMSNVDRLKLLREPFPPNQIGKLPKPTRQQAEEVKADYRKGIRCTICGQWHHPNAIHLDYVGHAWLTARLLDVDPHWSWKPLAVENGLPVMDGIGGMWIKLTVRGVTRLGYGHAGEKEGGDAIKEVIGDAIRNAAMRFGAALELWQKEHRKNEQSTTSSTAQLVKDSLPPEQDNPDLDLQALANNLSNIFEQQGARVAAEELNAADLSDEDYIRLWPLLGSRARAGIKAARMAVSKTHAENI
jgi:hypothetical protein